MHPPLLNSLLHIAPITLVSDVILFGGFHLDNIILIYVILQALQCMFLICLAFRQSRIYQGK